MKTWNILLIVILVVCLILFGLSIYKNMELQKDNKELKQYPITCLNFGEVISDSCALGCEYSSRFYNNPDQTNDCMINFCIGKALELKSKMCGVTG